MPPSQFSDPTPYQGFNISDEDIALLAAYGLKPIAGAQLPPIDTSSGGGKPGPYTFPGEQLPADVYGPPKPGYTLQPGSLTVDPNSGLLVFWNGTSFTLAPEYLQKAYSGLGTGGTADPLAAQKFAESIRQFNEQIKAQYFNSALDSESARRQTFATLTANRNNTAVSTAQTSADIAKQAAQFAANPRDTYAEALYRNQVGGSTPFGDTGNAAFGEYGKALAQKAQDIFSPVNSDMNALRGYRDAPFPVDFTSPSASVQQITGTGAPAAPAAPPPDNNAAALQFLQAMQDPQKAADFRNYVTGGAPPAKAMMHGGSMTATTMGAVPQVDFEGSPVTTTEGGLNINMTEPARLVGMWTGRTYATVAEPRPDGSPRPEQIIVKPLPSELEKDRALKTQHKAMTMNMGSRRMMATGGTVTSSPSIDEMNAQYSQLLQRLGGMGGGTSTPFAGARNLAGAPANAILNDPFLKGVTDATYSMKGIDPAELWAQVKQFTPNAIDNSIPRVNFL